MSRELYEKLQGAEGVELEDGEMVAPLLQDLARAGALRRAARELAQAELEEGTWADEAELPEERVRLAAQDRPEGSEAFEYSGGAWRLRLVRDGERWTVIQVAGPAGITLVLGESWVPLQPGISVGLEATVVAAMGGGAPERIELLDASGRRLGLQRQS